MLRNNRLRDTGFENTSGTIWKQYRIASVVKGWGDETNSPSANSRRYGIGDRFNLHAELISWRSRPHLSEDNLLPQAIPSQRRWSVLRCLDGYANQSIDWGNNFKSSK